MVLLMLSLVAAFLIVGTAALAGHPFLLLAAGLALAATVLLATRRLTVRRPR